MRYSTSADCDCDADDCGFASARNQNRDERHFERFAYAYADGGVEHDTTDKNDDCTGEGTESESLNHR